MAGHPSTLVIHPGALGDVLLAVPALRAFRRAHPDAPLTLAAQPRVGALLTALGIVDEALDFEGLGLGPLFVDGAEVDVPAIETATRVICWFGARDPVFVRRFRALAPAAVMAPPIPGDATPVWQHLVTTTGLDAGDGGEPIAVPPALVAEGAAVLRRAGWEGGTLLVVHAGAGGPAKQWPAEGFAGALEGRSPGLQVVLHEGPADHDAVAALASRLGPGALLLRQPSLSVLAGALTQATAYVGNDSGVSHLAAAVGAPALILFAAANLAWRPWSPAATVQTVAMPALEPADVAAVRAAVATKLA